MTGNPGTMIPRKKSDAFLGSVLDDDLVLMTVDTGRFHGLGGVARAVWDAIDGIRTVGAIQGAIADRYAVDRAICFDEVEAFLAELASAGLVDVS